MALRLSGTALDQADFPIPGGGTNAFTVSFWFKNSATANTWQHCSLGQFNFGTSTAPSVAYFGYELSYVSGAFHLQVGDGVAGDLPSYFTFTMTDDTAWHHIFISHETGTANPTVYIDGASKTLTVLATIAASPSLDPAYFIPFFRAQTTAKTLSLDDFRLYWDQLPVSAQQTIYACRGVDMIVAGASFNLRQRFVFSEKTPGATQGVATGVYKNLQGYTNGDNSGGTHTYVDSVLRFRRKNR